jgi:hypothetical protein
MSPHRRAHGVDEEKAAAGRKDFEANPPASADFKDRIAHFTWYMSQLKLAKSRADEITGHGSQPQCRQAL